MSDDGLYTDPVLVLDPGRHTAAIIRLDADREGRFLVTASHDKTVRVWAASDGRLLSTIRLPAGPGNVGKAYAAAISPDGTIVAAGGWTLIGDNDIYLFNRASGRLRHRVGGLPDVVLHLSFSQDGSRLAATLGSGGVRLIDPASGRVVAEDTDYGGQSYGAAFDEAGRLATTSYDGKLRLYDPALRLLRTVPAPGGRQPFGLAFSQGGKRLAVGYENGIRVDVLDGATMQHLLTPDSKGVDNGDLGRVAWSADGANLYAAGRWLPANGRRLRRWPEGGRGAPVDVALSRNTVMSLRPLPEGRLAFAAGDPRLGVLGGDGRERWSLGPAGADFRDQLRTLAVSADGVLVRFGYEYGGRSPALLRLTERRLVPEGSAEGLAAARVEAPGLAVEGWEDGFEPTLNGKPLALDAYEVARSLAIAPDGQRFVLGSEWSLRLFDRAGEDVWRQDVPGTVWTVAVSADGRLVVAAYADGTIRWHRLGDGEELLAFYPDGDRERWVLWTPKGYYDASPGAEDLIGWQVNRDRDEAPEFFTASRFRDQFHRPDVIDFVLKELDVDQAVARCSQAASVHQPMQHPPVGTKAVLPSLPPTVSIVDPLDGVTSEDEELVLSYLVETPPDDPPRALQVIVNGRTILRQLRVSSGPPARRLIVELPSDEATVTLIAENGAGAGDAASILVRRGGRRSPRAVIKPRLHVLAVGVSAYSETSWNLRYAAQDAEDVAMRLLREQDGLYREVRPNYLIDKEAKRRNILQALADLERTAESIDVAVFFFSGHGYLSGSDYFFLPHDAETGSDVAVQDTGLPDHRLKQSLRTVYQKGTKVVAMIDSCHAGALGKASGHSAETTRLAEDLAAAENGIVVMTSSTAKERSLEHEDWCNGAFTEAVLEALAGKADEDHNGFINLTDLTRYVKRKVRELTNDQQRPEVYFPEKKLLDPEIFRIC